MTKYAFMTYKVVNLDGILNFKMMIYRIIIFLCQKSTKKNIMLKT